MKRVDAQRSKDSEIWECVCDIRRLYNPFDLMEITDALREKLGWLGVMSRDMAVGRVLGALIRIEENSKDIEQLPTPGSYTWQLTNGSVE
jgi:hypothetical protein